MILSILATIATICVVSSYIPQIVKGYRTKSLNDISIVFLIVIIVGTITWMIYALIGKDYIFLTANSIILLFAIILFSMKIYYGKGKL